MAATISTLIGREDSSIVAGHDDRRAPLRSRVIAFHRAGDLLRACAERGLRVAWATSGTPQDVKDFQRAVGCSDAVHAVVNSGEVDHRKPAPDIVQAAVDAAGAPARRAVMVGDAVYDLRAAREVGSHASPCSAAASAKPSCVRRPAAIYANCADLLTQLDTSPIGALLRS